MALPIPFPAGGRSDIRAKGSQAPLTTREGTNMRLKDPVSGRLIGAQRAGLRKWNTNRVADANKIQDIVHVVADTQRITYAELANGSLVEEWDYTNPSVTASRNMRTDGSGNLYVLESRAGLNKINPDGKLVWSLTFPCEDADHEVTALWVTPSGDIYAGVSDGGDEETARLWRYRQKLDADAETVPEQVWQIEPGAFIAQVEFRNGLLYTTQRIDSENRSVLRVYAGADSAAPSLVRSREGIPHPANCLSVEANGDPVVAAPPNVDRNVNPLWPDGGPTAVSWTPRDLEGWKERVWCWLRADDLNGNGDESDGYDDGDAVDFFLDVTGKGRSLGQQASNPVPLFRRKGIGGKPSLRFDGTRWLVSGPNINAAPEHKDLQLTPFPAYDGAKWCMFIVMKATASATKRTVFYADRSSTGTLGLYTNREANTNINTAPTAAGDLSLFEDVTGSAAPPGAGSNTQPLAGDDSAGTGFGSGSSNATNTAIVTILHDGGANFVSGEDATKTLSLLRINGTPIDRWGSEAGHTMSTASEIFYLGEDPVNGNNNPFVGEIAEIIVLSDWSGGTALDPVLTHPRYGSDPGVTDAAYAGGSDTEMERIEAYLAWKYGVQLNLDDATYIHPWRLAGGPPPGPNDLADLSALVSVDGVIAKLSGANLAYVWTDTLAQGIGIGLVAWESPTTGQHVIYSVGNGVPASTSPQLYIATDEGESFDITSGANVSLADGSVNQINADYITMAVNERGVVYVPGPFTAHTNAHHVDAWGAGGAAELEYDVGAGDADQRSYACALPPERPAFPNTINRDEFVYVCGAAETYAGTLGQPTLRKIRLVKQTGSTGSPRSVTLLAVSDGSIKKGTAGGAAWSAITGGLGGSGALDDDDGNPTQYVMSVAAFSKVYFTNGIRYRVYDPVEDDVTEWASETAGGVPPRCKLIALWNGRMVLARGDNPQDVNFSAVGDPNGWDDNPPVPLLTQAIRLANAFAGSAPDIVNALIPITDDLLVLGCDHSIWVLRGDPMGNGRLDNVSQTVGIAFGKAWCIDPTGAVWFFSTRGGLYRMRPGGGIEWVSQFNIQRSLEGVDHGTHYVRLEYSFDEQAVLIRQIPYGAGGSLASGWAFEVVGRDVVPWDDRWAATGVQATAMHTLDGDAPDDRVLLIGCEDGYVREVDLSARSDDTAAIRSAVLMGPLAGPSPGRETRWQGPSVLLTAESDGASYELYATNTPDVVSYPVASGSLPPGRSGMFHDRARGAYTWLRVSNPHLGERFAIEDVRMRGYGAGRHRERSA